MKLSKCAKSIALVALMAFGGQIFYETSLIEKGEPKYNPMASLNIPPINHSPMPEHGPHSRAGIVYTMDGLFAVSTSTSTNFIKAL